MTEQMVVSMKRLAMFRQAEVSTQTYVAYALALAEEGETAEVVAGACLELSRLPREEGETAFPSLGTLLRECRRERGRREDARRHALALEGAKFEERYDRYQRELSPAEAKAFMVEFRQRVASARGAGHRDESRGLSLVKPKGAA